MYNTYIKSDENSLGYVETMKQKRRNKEGMTIRNTLETILQVGTIFIVSIYTRFPKGRHYFYCSYLYRVSKKFTCCNISSIFALEFVHVETRRMIWFTTWSRVWRWFIKQPCHYMRKGHSSECECDPLSSSVKEEYILIYICVCVHATGYCHINSISTHYPRFSMMRANFQYTFNCTHKKKIEINREIN